MRPILALALFLAPAFAPATAGAASLSDEAIGGHRTSCVKSCSSQHDSRTCARACDCMGAEMKRHWTQKTFDEHAATLKKDPKDRLTSAMVRQLAAYCLDKAQNR